MPRPARRKSQKSPADAAPIVGLRIIGGHHRGRRLEHSGDARTRPMKDRVREATFNRLGPGVRGTLAVDIFAGTGACGLEAVSRGAAGAIFVEQHRPTAELIERNIERLGLGQVARVIVADALLWARDTPIPGDRPWTVFVCPPYELLQTEGAAILALVAAIESNAPPGSTIVLESDLRFDWSQLPDAAEWDVRKYPPAVIGIRSIAGEVSVQSDTDE